jgi:hypothetical protein
MPFLAAAADVDCFVGGALRMAARDARLGAELARAAIALRVTCTDLDAQLTVDLYQPVSVTWNDQRTVPDVELTCSSDFLDAYMRGERRLVDALAHGEVVARGRVSKVLKILPVLEQSFAFYRQLVAIKENATSPIPGACA